jgi:hypothetical protein
VRITHHLQCPYQHHKITVAAAVVAITEEATTALYLHVHLQALATRIPVVVKKKNDVKYV